MRNTVAGTLKNAFVVIAVLLTTPIVLAQPASYWQMEFPTSESGPAQQHFLEGVTSMHLHMFEDAQEHFHEAQAISPDFAMAYWGEALNNHRTIWSIHRPDQARAVLRKLGATPTERAAKAPTQREKAYLGAIELLWGEGSQREREAAYSAAMARLSADYPADLEAKAWYALSLMRVTPAQMTRQRTRSLMAGLSLEILAVNSRHPGANRYLIQSTDDPENTDIGVIAVNNLEMLDMEAAEALHIPSHYYVQHGMWAEVAESNMKAFASSMAWVEERNWSLEDLNSHNYGHLLRFANYGFLQAGLLSDAAAIRDRVLNDFFASDGAPEIAAPLTDTFARMVVDLEQWSEAESLAELARAHNLRQPAIWTAIGLGAVRSDKIDLANEALNVLNEISDGSPTDGSIAALQIDGLLRIEEGNTRQGLSLLNDAIALNVRMNQENPVSLIGIPPRPVKPALELYGEALLDTGSAALALQQFERGLTTYRGRTNLLLGAARAATEAGKKNEATQFYEQLANIWTDADAGHPFTAEVNSALNN